MVDPVSRLRVRWFRGVSLLLLCLFGLQAAGCGYRLAVPGEGAGRIGPETSIWCRFISNESTSSTAQTVLARAVLEEALRLRGARTADGEAAADLVVSGRLMSYDTRAVSYSAIDRIREYRLAIDVEFAVKRRGETRPFWIGRLQSFRDFPAHDDLALQRNAEEAALRAAAGILAEKLLTSMEQGY